MARFVLSQEKSGKDSLCWDSTADGSQVDTLFEVCFYYAYFQTSSFRYIGADLELLVLDPLLLQHLEPYLLKDLEPHLFKDLEHGQRSD